MATNYSWGNIRLLLRTFAGKNTSLDVIDHTIRARYELILSTLEWKGIEQSGILQTTAGYSAGAITATPGSSLVVGTGTNWSGAYSGWQLFLGDGPVYTVTITGATTLTLDRPFEGFTGGGAYWIAKAVYNLPDSCRILRQIFSPFDGSTLDAIDEDIFGELEGSFLPVDTPVAGGRQATNYIPWTDGLNGATGHTVQRIVLYPVPVLSQGYPIKYDLAVDDFDGTGTSDGPLPWISSSALIAGCKADLETEKESPSAVRIAKYEGDFQKWLLGMIHIENGKRPKQRMRLDESYTDHRMARYLRSGGPAITQNWLLNSTGDNLQTGAGAFLSETPAGVADGTNSLFTLSHAPLTPVVVTVNGTLQILGANYVAAGQIVSFLAGSIPAIGAAVLAQYTY